MPSFGLRRVVAPVIGTGPLGCDNPLGMPDGPQKIGQSWMDPDLEEALGRMGITREDIDALERPHWTPAESHARMAQGGRVASGGDGDPLA